MIIERSKILVAHPWMGHGGSEATAVWLLHALQDVYDVTFVTASEFCFDRYRQLYEVDLNPNNIEVLKAPSFPFVKSGNSLVALQNAVFHRYCASIAGDYDLCVSAYNIIPFGKPGIQLIGDFSFDEEFRKLFYTHGFVKASHKSNFIRKAYLGLSKLIDVRSKPYHLRGDRVIANSKYISNQLEQVCQLPDCEVLYPPVLNLDSDSEEQRSPHTCLFIGRVMPEKGVDKMIDILDQVRSMGIPITLNLAGNTYQSDYEKMIAQKCTEREWINDLGYVTGTEKKTILAQSSFSIHLNPYEPFGISIAEMASQGCVTFVSSTCGSAEIQGDPSLIYSNENELVDLIQAFLKDPEAIEVTRKNIRDHVQTTFKIEDFIAHTQKIVASSLSNSCAHHSTAFASKKRSGNCSRNADGSIAK